MRHLRTAAAVFALWLCLAGCKDEAKRKECKEFSDWNNKTATAMQATVPESERTASKSPADYAKWHRKLAKAYLDESKKPLVFKHPDVQPLEKRMRASYGRTADVLDRMADTWEQRPAEGMEKSRPKMEALQLEDGKVNQERSAIMADWLRICSQK